MSVAATAQVVEGASHGGLMFRAGRFTVRLHTPWSQLLEGVQRMYADSLDARGPFADFTVQVRPPGGLRRWYRPQALFSLNGARPFAPLPREQAYPLLEWGLNWCVSSHCHQYLIIHAAVVEKHGRALILPGSPGAGKSTLTALLTGLGGWRLLSDELTLVALDTGELHANPRPVSLKNASIDLVRREMPGAVLSPPVRDTLKGTVAHLQPGRDSQARWQEPATPAWVIFPRFAPEVTTALRRLPRGEAFIRMADNAFNYAIHGPRGFVALTRLLDRCDCFELPNDGSVDTLLSLLDRLHQA